MDLSQDMASQLQAAVHRLQYVQKCVAGQMPKHFTGAQTKLESIVKEISREMCATQTRDVLRMLMTLQAQHTSIKFENIVGLSIDPDTDMPTLVGQD
jgi:hypothetical protein